MEYLRAFSSELLKIKRTRAFALSTGAPLAVTAFILTALLVAIHHRYVQDAWGFYLRGIAGSWCLIVTPLYVALLLALLTSIDHSAGAWKVLFSQPISRPPLYLAKLAVALLLLAWSQFVLAISSVIGGFLLSAIRPHFGDFHRGPDITKLLTALLLAYLASLLIIAIHLWLSVRIASFVLSLGVVILAEMANVLGMHQRALQVYWPWLYPVDAIQALGFQSDVILSHLIAASAIGATIVTALAVWDFSRREAF
ncbi:MAG TPA: ABC transporter permease [Terriglobia bacterium]|nr:ABC transporter permease [Terriglobia bacterium]